MIFFGCVKFFGGFWVFFGIIILFEVVLEKWLLEYRDYLRIWFIINVNFMIFKKKEIDDRNKYILVKEVMKVFFGSVLIMYVDVCL